MKRIQSRDNPAYKSWARLATSTRERRATGRILLDGLHLVEAYEAAFGLGNADLLLRDDAAVRGEIPRWLESRSCPAVWQLPAALFDRLSPVETPTGILAIVPRPDPGKFATDIAGFVVMLDGLQDPGNVGTIMRSAAAAGGRGVFLSDGCTDAWSPRCLRAGMGAHFILHVEERVDLVARAEELGIPLVVADMAGSASLFEAALPESCVFAVGAEGRGVSDALRQQASLLLRVPMAAGIESLNVAAAATLLFFEWQRRVERGPPSPCQPSRRI